VTTAPVHPARETVVDDVVSVLVHQLAGDAALLSGYAQVLAERISPSDAASGEALSAIVRVAARRRRIIDDLLDLTRLSTAEPALERLDVGALVDRAHATLREEPGVPAMAIDLGSVPPIKGDPTQVERLFLHLLRDAAAATPVGAVAQVRISGRRERGRVRIEVEDHGVPPPHALSAHFELGSTPRGRGGLAGAGVGGAVCRRIVKRHGGRIHASTSNSSGLVVSFTLPGVDA